jgi:hypothetical protein
MKDDQVSRAIEEIEVGLAHDDPAFVRRVRALRRAEIGTVITVFLLLAAGTVLLTVGVATASSIAWGAGLLSFLASFVIDGHHKHALQRQNW